MAAGGTLGFKISADAPLFVETDLSLDNDWCGRGRDRSASVALFKAKGFG
jgi:hypothetical protein